MRLIILSLLILASNSIINAQEFEGYYINKSGDTVRGKIQVPKGNVTIIGSTSVTMGRVTPQSAPDPLKDLVKNESKKIDYSKLTFDIKFSENDSKFKKIDRLKIKGFGFTYEGRQYDFITWDITANKQLYQTSPFSDVASDGVYSILRSVTDTWTIYSLFQEFQLTKQSWDNRPNAGTAAIKKEFDGVATKRDIIFEHPTKGLIYISNQYPLKMKFNDALKFLELEDEFIKTLDKKDNIFDVVLKYNAWKAKK